MERTGVTMPRWPAYVMLAAAAACAYPAVTADRPVAKSYTALGQEPGWRLIIAGDRIDYLGDYGETRINVARPGVRATVNGHRYETPRLVVDVTHIRCNDAMSGHGYADTVKLIADGKSVSGCGGVRRPDWDS